MADLAGDGPVLELALGAATVAVGWSGYLNQLLGDLGIPRTAVAFMGYWRLGSAG